MADKNSQLFRQSELSSFKNLISEKTVADPELFFDSRTGPDVCRRIYAHIAGRTVGKLKPEIIHIIFAGRNRTSAPRPAVTRAFFTVLCRHSGIDRHSAAVVSHKVIDCKYSAIAQRTHNHHRAQHTCQTARIAEKVSENPTQHYARSHTDPDSP